MIVGVPSEVKTDEFRVGMRPVGVELMVREGHTVLIQSGAGLGSGFSDEQYGTAGAQIAHSAEDVWSRAELIVKVKEPQAAEIALVREQQFVFTYFHFAADKGLTTGCLDRKCISIAYETLTDDRGGLPLLTPMSEVAGKLSVQEGAKYLERPFGGKGILLGGVPGVAPGHVLILGGGVVGTCAAQVAAGMGANVVIMDISIDRLRRLAEVMPANVRCVYSDPQSIRERLTWADVIIGAVLVPGAKAPWLVRRDDLKHIQPGSVIVDVAIDQGGCVETSRVTTHRNPVYDVDGIVHYCVGNMPGAVARTSTIALTNVTLPWALKIAKYGPDRLARMDHHFASAINTHRGTLTNQAVAQAHDLEFESPFRLNPRMPFAPTGLARPEKVNVLLIGNGGREHALAWKLRQSAALGELWVEEGANAGLRSLGQACPEAIDKRHMFRLERWCERERIDLVVVGPEGPLEQDFATLLASERRVVFGPTREAARIEWDKAYAKQLMRSVSIPTAEGRSFESADAAMHYVSAREEPLVVKAAGLAAGKGVTVCADRAEALDAIARIMGKRQFGDAGAQVVIEERLKGQEVSVLALVDGRTISVLDPCQDHKQVGEGDVGPNTGGMGAYSPTPLADDALLDVVQREILVPAIDGLRREGAVFRGVLYAGIMLTAAGPKVLEFNARFGDPETQALMVRLDADLVDLLWATATGTLDRTDYAFDAATSCCVSVCSAGYPGAIERDRPISGLDEAAAVPGVTVFHGGTARTRAGGTVTAGGRVVSVTALGTDLAQAQRIANGAAELVRFEGAFFRRDIGSRVLRATSANVR